MHRQWNPQLSEWFLFPQYTHKAIQSVILSAHGMVAGMESLIFLKPSFHALNYSMVLCFVVINTKLRQHVQVWESLFGTKTRQTQFRTTNNTVLRFPYYIPHTSTASLCLLFSLFCLHGSLT